MKLLQASLLPFIFIFSVMCVSCETSEAPVFTVENDIALGSKMAQEIAANPDSYPVLDEASYDYDYLTAMLSDILSSEALTYQEEFAWKINVIDDAQALNLFTTPGGQIYLYTGLIYFLDKEDDLAGALAHEITHADKRHISKKLQRTYGISYLIDLSISGQASDIQELINSMSDGSLPFSSGEESEADEYSVRFLSETAYACNGAVDFFGKLIANEETFEPEYLVTHPPADSTRLDSMDQIASQVGCSTLVDEGSAARYRAFRNSLP